MKLWSIEARARKSLQERPTPSRLLSSPVPACVASVALLFAGQVFAEDGAALYKEKCAGCHGIDGKADSAAAKAMKVPALAGTTLTPEEVVQKVRTNEKHKMVSSRLSDEQLTAIASHRPRPRYVLISTNQNRPTRPRRIRATFSEVRPTSPRSPVPHRVGHWPQTRGTCGDLRGCSRGASKRRDAVKREPSFTTINLELGGEGRRERERRMQQSADDVGQRSAGVRILDQRGGVA